MINLTNNAKFIGTVIEERDGVKVLVEKYEKVTFLVDHNAKIDAAKTRLDAEKVADSVEVGTVIKEPVDYAKKMHDAIVASQEE